MSKIWLFTSVLGLAAGISLWHLARTRIDESDLNINLRPIKLTTPAPTPILLLWANRVYEILMQSWKWRSANLDTVAQPHQVILYGTTGMVYSVVILLATILVLNAPIAAIFTSMQFWFETEARIEIEAEGLIPPIELAP